MHTDVLLLLTMRYLTVMSREYDEPRQKRDPYPTLNRIKKVTRVFEREVLARRALREVAVLRHIGSCDNVTALLKSSAALVVLLSVASSRSSVHST